MTRNQPWRIVKLCLCSLAFSIAAASVLANIRDEQLNNIGIIGGADAPPQFYVDKVLTEELTLAEGDTLNALLLDNNINLDEAEDATEALARLVNLSRLAIGQPVTLYLAPLRRPTIRNRLIGLSLVSEDGMDAVAFRDFDDTFKVQRMPHEEAVATLTSIYVAPQNDSSSLISRGLFLADGGTLHDLLVDNGAAPGDVMRATDALGDMLKITHLQPGQEITAIFRHTDGQAKLAGLSLTTPDGKRYGVGCKIGGEWHAGPPEIAQMQELADIPIPPPGKPNFDKPNNEAATSPTVTPVVMQAEIPSQPLAVRTEYGRPRAVPAVHGAFREVTVSTGATFISVLRKAGFSRADAVSAAEAVDGLYDLRKLPTGATIEYIGIGGATPILAAARVQIDAESQLRVVRVIEGTFDAKIEKKNKNLAFRRIEATIKTNLYEALVEAEAPMGTIMELINVYSHNVDLQREIRGGDKIALIYETFIDDQGQKIEDGPILYASIILSGEKRGLYRQEMADGNVDYYDQEGNSVRNMLMRTPIEGARLTSRFGMRRHPIRGYNHMHKGVDFAAPAGTPVYAAGDGTIDRASWVAGYGYYICIRHNSEYRTAYAHLKKFAPGLYPGRRVRQGEVIGYVGSTGSSTGPHLHYEVIYNGKRINPLNLDIPARRSLDQAELKSFLETRRRLDYWSEVLPATRVVAANSPTLRLPFAPETSDFADNR